MEEEIQLTTEEEYNLSLEQLLKSRWDFNFKNLELDHLQNFISTNNTTFLMQPQNEYLNNQFQQNVINFNVIDEFLSDESSETEQNVLQKSPSLTFISTKKQNVIKENQKTNGKQLNSTQEQQLNKTQQQIQQDSSQVQNKPFKPKKQMLREQMREYEMFQDNTGLTYYQRKKNFIQNMKEKDLLLDWDSFKKDDLIYEQSSFGAARRKKKNKKQIDIIELPHPEKQPQQQNEYQKEAKSYRKIPRSQRSEINGSNSKNGNAMEEEEEPKVKSKSLQKEASSNIQQEQKQVQYKPFKRVTMIAVDKQELINRREDFLHYQFINEKKINTNNIYISSRAQAQIPQIRPVEEVRNTWILKDLDSILAYKNSSEYQKLEEYMNKFFGLRAPWQVFNILKLNKYNLKNSIDYCNMNSDFLKAYFLDKDNEKKKKQQKRRLGLEKKKYV
ncbi:hypothetical protein TTHERM_00265090 (macronuclear) [Tetrahymena thermophila SB210]|uniref:Uncharacterized protein n=1 Tax=Tetrahymena thermophila (strain SB210) TaxID=312017 RepID=Q22TY1_TETTS|nr:hypothetical protein TTHERM_00265090 [Tetrahymena thermophila SB210]EAR88906.1 hypothetical protein TTHERM_00265090 [Tetrahymena thermophila SB210]|eukprot:XP_001009151.1 hypothetical protein TTHERM_00265090 [Tetrahymena thermophila SB210]